MKLPASVITLYILKTNKSRTKYVPGSWHIFYKEYKKDKFLEKLKKNKTENTLFSTFKATK
jgi:hypothetical protein